MYDITTHEADTTKLEFVSLAKDRASIQIGLEVFIIVVIWLLSVFGNAFVCIVISRSRRIQSTTNYFVISLACSDLLLAVLTVPFLVTRVIASRWLVGQLICKLVRFVQFLVPCVNMYVLTSIAIDRFYTIIYPLSFKVTKGTAKRMIIFSWVPAVALSGFCFYFFDVITNVEQSGRDVCMTYIPADSWPGIVFVLLLFSAGVLVPTVILLLCYIRLFRYIWRIEIGPKIVHRTMNPVPRTKVKVIKMLIVVTMTSLTLYLPFFLTQTWHCLAQPGTVEPTAFIATSWLVCATGMSKPLVYLCYNANFRRGCKEVLCMSTMHCYRRNTYAITHASSLGKKNYIGVMESSVTESPFQISPTKNFNRARMVEKSMWPLSGKMSSTYI